MDNSTWQIYRGAGNLPEVNANSVNRSQSVIGSQRHRNPSVQPLTFTEHGAIMEVLDPPPAPPDPPKRQIGFQAADLPLAR